MILEYWQSGIGVLAGAVARPWGRARGRPSEVDRDGRAGRIAPAAQSGPLPRARVAALCLLGIVSLFLTGTTAAAPPNTEITNVARATYTVGNLNDLASASNEVTVITVGDRSRSMLEFLRYAPGNAAAEPTRVSTTYYSLSGLPAGPFEPLVPPVELGSATPIDLSRPVPLISSTRFVVGEPVFMRLADSDQNTDSLLSETILIYLVSPENGESELLRLTESDVNTGLFTGYIQSDFGLASAVNNGLVAAQEGNSLRADYSDAIDVLDASSDTLIFLQDGTTVFMTKAASKSIVSAGDYLQYSLTVENTGAVALDDIGVRDHLPVSTRYQPGSTTIDAAPGSEPVVSSDGSTLTFSPGILAAGESRRITYVVEVGPTVRAGELTNRAYAVDVAGVVSNIASVTVRVREEFFRSEIFLAGRVMIGECDTVNAGRAGEGIAGVRVYLEDGAYTVTDSNGMYHFEGIAPGTHVVQLERGSLPEWCEAWSCDDNSRSAGNPFSKFVDVQAGGLWQVDFEVRLKPRQLGKLQVKLSSRIDSAIVHYTVDIGKTVVPVRDVRLLVMLPEQAAYLGGTARLSADSIGEPSISGSGNLLTFNLGDMAEERSERLSFDAALRPFDTTAELRTQCLVIFDSPDQANQKTPPAWNSLTVSAHEDRLPSTPIILSPYFPSFQAELDSLMQKNLDAIVEQCKGTHILHVYVTGHSDNSPIGPRGRRIYPDNYALSLARAQTVATYLAERLNLDSTRLTVTGRGPDEPVADSIARGKKELNRRVDITVISETVTRYQLRNIARSEDSLSVDITGLRPGEVPGGLTPAPETPASFEELSRKWLENGDPKFEWLWPPSGHNPPIPSVKVAIKHDPASTPQLRLNGADVPALNFSETVLGQSGATAVSIWTGIDLSVGANEFSALVSDANGSEQVITRSIHFSGPPVGVRIIDSLSVPVADGRRPAVIAVQFTDAEGHPARPGVSGEWSVDPPYVARQEIDDLRDNPLLKIAGQRPKYVIGENGIALLELQATSKSGEALLRFNLLDREEEIRVWLRPAVSDWVVVGLAEETIGYNSTGGSSSLREDAGIEDDAYGKGRASFFARGSIKGGRLLTLAIDSKRWGAEPDSNMFRTVHPESYYALYGDGTAQGYDVASSRGIYAKVEAANYYGLFGDFNTGLNAAQLTRYNRSFNGLKFEGSADRQSLNAFLSRSNQAFVRDELPGNGTSGPYRLSRTNIVANSEQVVVETRDRFQNEVIIIRRPLRQYQDYTIDYYSGALYFKSPVPSRDDRFNPVFITVDYESNDAGDRSYNYGGRGAVNLKNENVTLGGTYLHEGRIGGYGHLGGVDAAIALGDGLELKTEFAASRVKRGDSRSNGNAYLIELQRTMKQLTGRLFIRDQDSRFGLGQQNVGERGMRKFGADASYRLRESLVLNGQAYRQSYSVSGARRNFGELKINSTGKRLATQGGLRYAEDRLGDGTVNRSGQLMAGGAYKVWAERLELRLLHEQSIAKNDNPDFPTRTTLGADYHLTRHLVLFAQQDFADGSSLAANDTRFGFRAEPWKGGRIRSDIDRTYNENTQRLFANIGLTQAWRINDRLSVDVSLDHGDLITGGGDQRLDTNLTPASGGPDDFTALSLGGAYREKKWSSAVRLEFRDSDMDERWGIVINTFGEKAGGLGLLGSARIYSSRAAAGMKKRDGDIRFGLVLRPAETRWMALNRLDFIYSVQTGGQLNYDNWRLVDNLSINYQFSKRFSASAQYGAKYMREDIDSTTYSGYTDLIGLEARCDLTRRWDVGGRLSLLHAWNLNQQEYGSSLSTGYSVFKNAWLSLGYNFSGFEDRDFADGDYTAQGPFLQFRLKFDDMTARDIAEQLGL